LAKNPQIKKAFEDGVSKGIELGTKKGVFQATVFFQEKFMDLQKVKGFGPSTIDKFKEHFGHEYFIERKDG
jgi:hypothetical protein